MRFFCPTRSIYLELVCLPLSVVEHHRQSFIMHVKSTPLEHVPPMASLSQMLLQLTCDRAALMVGKLRDSMG